MNPNLTYQLYQSQRIKTRAEILADDARRGRQAAAVSRCARGLARVTLGQVLSHAYRRRSPSMA
jgi:lambda repressor-like predicted transcriptional regulator